MTINYLNTARHAGLTWPAVLGARSGDVVLGKDPEISFEGLTAGRLW